MSRSNSDPLMYCLINNNINNEYDYNMYNEGMPNIIAKNNSVVQTNTILSSNTSITTTTTLSGFSNSPILTQNSTLYSSYNNVTSTNSPNSNSLNSNSMLLDSNSDVNIKNNTTFVSMSDISQNNLASNIEDKSISILKSQKLSKENKRKIVTISPQKLFGKRKFKDTPDSAPEFDINSSDSSNSSDLFGTIDSTIISSLVEVKQDTKDILEDLKKESLKREINDTKNNEVKYDIPINENIPIKEKNDTKNNVDNDLKKSRVTKVPKKVKSIKSKPTIKNENDDVKVKTNKRIRKNNTEKEKTIINNEDVPNKKVKKSKEENTKESLNDNESSSSVHGNDDNKQKYLPLKRNKSTKISKDSNTSYNPECECDICNKIFSRKYDLIRHRRIHTGDTPYKCKICGAGFTRSDHRDRHIRRTACGETQYYKDLIKKTQLEKAKKLERKRKKEEKKRRKEEEEKK